MFNYNAGKALRPIHNHIIFQFLDATMGRGFSGGFSPTGLWIAPTNEDTIKSPRWAKVYALGHECSTDLVEPFNMKPIEVLIEPLMWTKSFYFNGEKYWRTDESKILAWRYVDEK